MWQIFKFMTLIMRSVVKTRRGEREKRGMEHTPLKSKETIAYNNPT
jgi:hypothetical protein